MNERSALVDALLKLLAVCVFAILYCVGGMGFLFLRRYVAPVELMGAMLYFSGWDLRSLASLTGIGSLCLGYGGDLEWTKIFKRLLFGFANGLTFSLPNLLNKRFLLAGFQVILVPVTCIAFGVWNPFSSARVEELVIGFEIAFIPIMSARRKS